MAKLSDAVKTLHSDQLGDNVPPEMISAINVFMREVANAVGGGPSQSGGNLSLSDNLQCELKTGTFDHGVATAVLLTKLKRANGITVISSGSPRATPTLSYPVLYCGLQGSNRQQQVLVTMNFLDVSAKQVPVTFALWPEGSLSSSAPSRQQSWQVPTLLNSYTVAARPVGYFKDALGIVHLRGTVTGGTISWIFTLPAGYRPSQNSLFATDHNGAYGRVAVITDGSVTSDIGGFSNVILDGITFLAEQ